MAWKVSARRGLPIVKQSSWNSNAKATILNQFKKDGGGYKSGAAGAFLLYDPDKKDTQQGYKLPFAVVSSGKITGASSAGLAAAARRLPQTKGVPAATLKSARAVIDSYQKKMKESGMEDLVAELDQDVGSFSSQLRRAFSARFRIRPEIIDGESYTTGWLYVEDVFVDHPTLGNCVVVDKTGTLWQVAYTGEGPSLSFDPPEKWIQVYRTYTPAPTSASESEVEEVFTDDEVAELGESESGAILGLVESSDTSGPLQLRIAVIEPGWGNKRDNNFYPRDVLERDASVFEGAKMYATNHRSNEKSVLTEVSQILECPTGFTESGAPIARVGVFDSHFAESIRNRAALGVLDGLHCSILARGQIQKGFTASGRTGQRVTAITEAASVDWVTQHGAGGRALSLNESDNSILEESMSKQNNDVIDAESEATTPEESEVLEAALVEEETPAATDEQGDTETTDEQPADEETDEEATESEPDEEAETFLSESEVKDIFSKVKTLPDATRKRLMESRYHNRFDALRALELEQQYLKSITDSGKPPTFGESNAAPPAKLTESEVRERQQAVNAKFLPNMR